MYHHVQNKHNGVFPNNCLVETEEGLKEIKGEMVTIEEQITGLRLAKLSSTLNIGVLKLSMEISEFVRMNKLETSDMVEYTIVNGVTAADIVNRMRGTVRYCDDKYEPIVTIIESAQKSQESIIVDVDPREKILMLSKDPLNCCDDYFAHFIVTFASFVKYSPEALDFIQEVIMIVSTFRSMLNITEASSDLLKGVKVGPMDYCALPGSQIARIENQMDAYLEEYFPSLFSYFL